MVKQIRKTALVIAALGALALGGSALAQAGSSPSKPSAAAHVTSKAKPAKADAEQPDGTETADGGNEAAGSEVPDNDGPGGHADEPGNPSADHQAQGQE
jgi:hypothetical protein